MHRVSCWHFVRNDHGYDHTADDRWFLSQFWQPLVLSTPCVKKRVNLFVALCRSYKFILIKIGRYILEETLNKTEQKVLTSSKICTSTTLGDLK